jgi:hypothetical protein
VASTTGNWRESLITWNNQPGYTRCPLSWMAAFWGVSQSFPPQLPTLVSTAFSSTGADADFGGGVDADPACYSNLLIDQENLGQNPNALANTGRIKWESRRGAFVPTLEVWWEDL